MIYFRVFVEDHITKEKVVVGDLLTKSEAVKLSRVISDFQACTVYVVESDIKGE